MRRRTCMRTPNKRYMVILPPSCHLFHLPSVAMGSDGTPNPLSHALTVAKFLNPPLAHACGSPMRNVSRLRSPAHESRQGRDAPVHGRGARRRQAVEGGQAGRHRQRRHATGGQHLEHLVSARRHQHGWPWRCQLSNGMVQRLCRTACQSGSACRPTRAALQACPAAGSPVVCPAAGSGPAGAAAALAGRW